MAVADSHVLDSMQGLRYIKPFHHCPEQSKKEKKAYSKQYGKQDLDSSE